MQEFASDGQWQDFMNPPVIFESNKVRNYLLPMRWGRRLLGYFLCVTLTLIKPFHIPRCQPLDILSQKVERSRHGQRRTVKPETSLILESEAAADEDFEQELQKASPRYACPRYELVLCWRLPLFF